MKENECPDCFAVIGEQHSDNCDVARCTWCGGQYISCLTELGEKPICLGRPDIWEGEWPGNVQCRELGLWCIRNPDGPGYLSVPVGTEGATEDLNRLGAPEFKWNRDIQAFVKEVK